MKKLGEIISASQNKEDLQFYKEHPDYNPNPLSEHKNNLYEFLEQNSRDNNINDY